MLSHQGVKLFDRIRRVRRHGLLGGSMSLGVGFELSKAHTGPGFFLSLLPANQDVKLSAVSPAPYPPMCFHAPCHDDNALSL